MSTNCAPFQYFENAAIEILCSMIELLCVFVENVANMVHTNWVVVFKHCISFEMDLSTLKLASTKGATKYKLSFSFTQDNVV